VKICKRSRAVILVAAASSAVGVLSPRLALAQFAINTLTSFNGSPTGADPREGLLTLSGNTLYGTTEMGGANNDGEVFSLPVTGGTPTVLASFNGTNGQNPLAGLTLSGNTLYGTTFAGGPNGNGEVFSVPVTGGSPNVLASFDAGLDGGSPRSGLIVSGGTLYGSTVAGGPDRDGVVFSVPIGGGTPTPLGSFTGSNGSQPTGDLALSDGILYGTTREGGTSNDGVIFSVPVTGGTPTALASFDVTNGAAPFSGPTLSGTMLYGLTTGGGGDGYGDVYSFPIGGGAINVLASFDVPDGVDSVGDPLISGNILYGTTGAGGDDGFGDVFSVPTAGVSLSVMASFDNVNGAHPFAGLIMDSSGNLYGTTSLGGNGGAPLTYGTVFEVVVPEPASTSLLAIGSLALLRRRRRIGRRAADSISI